MTHFPSYWLVKSMHSVKYRQKKKQYLDLRELCSENDLGTTLYEVLSFSERTGQSSYETSPPRSQ